MNRVERRIPSFLNVQKGRGAESSSEQQRTNINKEIALREDSVYKVIGQRKVPTLIRVYQIQCKCEHEVKKEVLRIGEEKEQGYM
jgi:hypothetical protein